MHHLQLRILSDPSTPATRSIRRAAASSAIELLGNEPAAGAVQPEMALIVSSYQKARHLQLVLASIALQQSVAGKIELVVSDDGSTDETPSIVEQFKLEAEFPVRFTTHRHRTFQLARCRNEGTAASIAPYLVFLDGDCVLPPDFALEHLRRRKPGTVMTGDCYRLSVETSARVDESVIRTGAFLNWAPPGEVRRLAKQHRKARLYNLIRHRSKPRVLGGNVGVWRADFERVNGYDEDFEGWGCEDDDLGFRLRKAGLRIESIRRWTRAYHLWHTPDATAPARWREGPNVQKLLGGNRPMFAVNGLHKRGFDNIAGLADAAEPAILPFQRPVDRLLVGSAARRAA